MLKIRKKRLVLSALVAAGLVVPAGAFAVGNLAKTNDSFAFSITPAAETAMNNSNFYDANMWGCVVRGKYGDSATQTQFETALSASELASISELHCWGAGTGDTSINIAGINQLTGLTFLQIANYKFPSINLSYFTKLQTLDLSSNTSLKRIGDPDVVGVDGPDSKFNCGSTLKTVSLSGDTSLAGKIDLSNYSNLTSLDISGAKNIKGLDVSRTGLSGKQQWNNFTKLTSLNVTGTTGITELDVSNTWLSSLDVSTLTSLTNLNANKSYISSIILPNSGALTHVGLAENNLPSTITLPTTCKIKYLNVRDNSKLSKIDNLEKCSDLKSLAINDDNFSTINIDSNTQLEALKASGNSGLLNNKSNPINITNNKSLKNIQLGESTDVAVYVKIDDVSPTAISGGFEYDFSDYSIVDSSAVSFMNREGYSASGSTITLTDYSSTDGYAQVQQSPDPFGSSCSTDDFSCNDGVDTFFKNNYRLLLNEPDAPATFTVTYNLKGGSGSFPLTQTCTAGESCKTPNSEPTLANNTFEGWAKTDGGSVVYTKDATITGTSDITLYAVWKPAETPSTTYTITYNQNAGGETVTNFPSNTSCTDSACSSFKIDSKTPARDGYTFLGWATSASGNVAHQPGGNVNVTGNLTLYAKWQKNDTPTPTTYKLIFDPNGGNGSAISVPCTNASSCSVEVKASYAPERDGYTFLGWSDDKNATTPDAKYNNGSVVSLNGSDKTIYAVWLEDTDDTKTFVVAFDANEGKDAPGNVSCKGTESCKTQIPDETPTRSGYKFIGWGTTKDAKEVAYKPGDNITLAEDITLFAMWEKTGSDKEAESGIAAPNTGGNLEGGNGGLVAVLTATPIIALGALVGIKLTKGRKSHIKFD